MNAKLINVWRCETCGSHYLTINAAEECCTNNSKQKKVCQDCGIAIDPKSYFCICDGCREKHRCYKCKKNDDRRGGGEIMKQRLYIRDNHIFLNEHEPRTGHSMEYDLTKMFGDKINLKDIINLKEHLSYRYYGSFIVGTPNLTEED